MDPAAVLDRCRKILADTPGAPLFDAAQNPIAGFAAVRAALRDLPTKNRPRDLRPFLENLSSLEGDFTRIIERDPMVLYLPAHEVALAFHSSDAFIRYFRAGNRCSKSQSGYAEHYFVATGQHRWRRFQPPPTASFIVGVNFSKYEVNTFRKKMVTGETDNVLAPMFPEGGKWLYKYDDRKHILYIACPDCAHAGRAGSCRHMKSTITLFSDKEGPDVLQGGQYNLAHFDEHIHDSFFPEARQRIQTVQNSSFIVTGTPLGGLQMWEHKELTTIFEKGSAFNRVAGTDIPYVSLHVIDQYTAGLIPKEKIDDTVAKSDPLDVESRVYGRPSPLARHSVFDRYILHEMSDQIRDPGRFSISKAWLAEKKIFPAREGDLSIWKKPELEGHYILGGDVAVGLTGRDYSCGTVLKVPDLEVVAQLHGWINPVDFAWQLASLGALYNNGWLVIERNGPGTGTIHTLRQIGYPNLFREITDIAQSEFNIDPIYGVDTNIRSKSYMVSFLQKVVSERVLTLPSGPTLEEMRAFGEEELPNGQNVRLRGEGGMNDDRVMSLVLAVYVALAYSLFDFTRSKMRDTTIPEEDAMIWEGFRQEMKDAARAKRRGY